MSIFKPNLDKFSSKVFIAPANEYEVEVASVKYRAVDIKNGARAGQKMHMIDVATRIIADTSGDKEFENKPISVSFILDPEREDSFDRLIRFVMCCKGIRPGSEESDNEFKTRFGDLDLSVDIESGEIGAGYASLAKNRVIVNVGIRTQGDKQYQDYKSCRPF
jgi:hypothetical protein